MNQAIFETTTARQAFHRQCSDEGAPWLKAVKRRFCVDHDASVYEALTEDQLWKASLMSLADLAAL